MEPVAKEKQAEVSCVLVSSHEDQARPYSVELNDMQFQQGDEAGYNGKR